MYCAKKPQSWTSAQAAARQSPKRSHNTVSVYSPATASRNFCQQLLCSSGKSPTIVSDYAAMSQLDVHKKHLQQHCRVCLQKLGKVHYACSSTTCKPLLLSCMGIDTTKDRECVHPPNTCNNCYAKMKKTEAGALSSTLISFPFSHRLIVRFCFL